MINRYKHHKTPNWQTRHEAKLAKRRARKGYAMRHAPSAKPSLIAWLVSKLKAVLP